MKTLITRLLAVTAAMLLSMTALADMTGTWVMQVQTDQGGGSPTFALTQDGNALSGTYKGQLGEAPVTGKVEGDSFEINYSLDGGGMQMKVVYSGTLDGDSVSGKLDLGGMASGTFTGKKQ